MSQQPVDKLRQIEESYNKRIDNDIVAMVNHFENILRLSETSKIDPVKASGDTHSISIHAAVLQRTVESLLTLTQDLKTALLLRDFDSMLQVLEERKKERDVGKVKMEIAELESRLHEYETLDSIDSINTAR